MERQHLGMGMETRDGKPYDVRFPIRRIGTVDRSSAVRGTESGWQAMENSFTEKGISYDRNGNILTLKRTANGNTVDDLAYSYNGNLLTGVAENIRSVEEGDVYAPGSSVSATFEYDGNGNLVKNGHLGLEFQYNCLNLPWYVKRDGKTLATFYYLGDGTKVRTVDSAGVARHYIGSLTYRQEENGNLVLEEAAFDGGIVKVREDGTPETFYCIADHLGSVRAIVDADGNAVERNDYYPFGAQHARADYLQIANRYKFNGKEREKAGGADWLDYGARRYDPALARWTTPDPLGDSYLPYSPYAYCLNNPIKLVDPNGAYMDWFMNEVSGDVYYNSTYGKNDAENINGEGWTWLGGNGMFSAGTVGDLLSDWDAILHGSDNFRLRVENVGTEDNPEFNIEAQIQGESAKSFMKGKGYDFKPKEYIYQKDVIRDLHPEATGQPMEITIDNSHILEVLSYQYVPETANLKESKVLKSDNTSGFTLNWGLDTSEINTDTGNYINYDGKIWSFDGLWTAATKGALIDNAGKVEKDPISLGRPSNQVGEVSVEGEKGEFNAWDVYLQFTQEVQASGVSFKAFADASRQEDEYATVTITYTPSGSRTSSTVVLNANLGQLFEYDSTALTEDGTFRRSTAGFSIFVPKVLNENSTFGQVADNSAIDLSSCSRVTVTVYATYYMTINDVPVSTTLTTSAITIK